MTREQRRARDEVREVLNRMTSVHSDMIHYAVCHLVEGTPATQLADGKKNALIYRTKQKYQDAMMHLTRLAECTSKLFARQVASSDCEPFPVCLNMDRTELLNGKIWYSPTLGKSFWSEELLFFILNDDHYIPCEWCISPDKTP